MIVVVVGLWRSTDVDEVGVDPIGSVGFTLAGIVRDDRPLLVGDVDLCSGSDGAGERALVKGVEEAVQVSTLVPDDLTGHAINDEGEENGDPGLRVSICQRSHWVRVVAHQTIP